jgi:hypothetical protein
MLPDLLRRLLYPAAVLTVIVTVWAVSWSASLRVHNDRTYWPATNMNGDVMQLNR